MEELEIWLQGFIKYTQNKIENIKNINPNHHNIKVFEGELIMAKKIVSKIKELTKKN